MVARELRVPIHAMIHWTSVLLTFCKDHRHAPVFLERLQDCISALEHREVSKALAIYKELRTARMGSFLDWSPPPIHSETQKYSEAVFGSLFASWVQTMDLGAANIVNDRSVR